MPLKLVFIALSLALLQTIEGAPKEDICSSDPDIGGCRVYNVRYYYSPYTGKCHEFIFGGCLGNKNNFETLEECEAFCEGLEMEKDCSKTADRGPCEGFIWRYHYDHDAEECKTFVYSGCRGNGNNFGTLKECSQTCINSER